MARHSAILSGLILCFTLMIQTDNAHAKIYKCIDADGSTSYSQMPCQTDQSSQTVSTGVRASSNNDCRIANHFAMAMARKMRRGKSSSGLFADYGGINSVPNTAIGIINYVYTHKDNIGVTPERITALSAARCSADAYGPVECDNFPYSYIEQAGGCEMAAKSPQVRRAPQNYSTNPGNNNATQQGLQQGMAVRAPQNNAAYAAKLKSECIADVDQQLANIFAQMRQSQSAGSQQQLQEERNTLRREKSRC